MLALLAVARVRAGDFSGTEALAFTKHLVSFGPRPSGSDAIRAAQ